MYPELNYPHTGHCSCDQGWLRALPSRNRAFGRRTLEELQGKQVNITYRKTMAANGRRCQETIRVGSRGRYLRATRQILNMARTLRQLPVLQRALEVFTLHKRGCCYLLQSCREGKTLWYRETPGSQPTHNTATILIHVVSGTWWCQCSGDFAHQQT